MDKIWEGVWGKKWMNRTDNAGFEVEVQLPLCPVLFQRNWAQMG